MFTLMGQRIEAYQGVVDKARVAHHQAAIGQAVQELLHQLGEIGLLRKIIRAGKAGVEGEVGAGGALAELVLSPSSISAFGDAEPLRQRPVASALAHPGVGRMLLDGRKKGIAHLRKQLHVLVAVDEVGARPNRSAKAANCAAISACRISRSSRRSRPRCSSFGSGRNMPPSPA